uniref:Ig-like domain-containing protein n=1 Tax=Gadus morhua TaxID=8049 RepID=A0A8C5C707_GADMO
MLSPASETTAESNSAQMSFPEPKYSGVLRHLLHQLCFQAGAGIPEVVTNLGDTDTEVFTREGEDAILPCGLGSPVNLKDEVVDWKKKQQEVFFYEKGKHYNNGKRGQDPQFGGRVHLLPGGLQAGDASVILSSATQADGGVYSCFFPPLGPTRLIRLTVVLIEAVPIGPVPVVMPLYS